MTVLSEQTEVTTECEVKNADFARVLGNALVGAGTDLTLPVLCTVRVTVKAGRMELAATDRYVLVTDSLKIDYDGYSPEWSALITVDACKRIISSLKADKVGYKQNHPIRLDLQGNQFKVTTYQESFTVNTFEGQFPDVNKLLDGAGKADELGIDKIAFDPSKLARFDKVKSENRSKHEVMVMSFGAGSGKPAKVTIGETFVGLIMPVRLSG